MNTLRDRVWLAVSANDEESWAQTCAGLGAIAWAAIAVLARVGMAPIGAIELIFLFAPLMVVPLGMELGRVMGWVRGIDLVARRVQPIAGGLAIFALWLPPGKIAGGLAAGWMAVCGLVGFSGVIDLLSGGESDVGPTFEVPTSPKIREKWGTQFCGGVRSSILPFALAVAKMDLAVGGMWFVASRIGMRPMGIQEPIGLLTAVHFHFAGFATALIAAATLRFAEAWADRWLKWIVIPVVGMPYVVAAGFVVSPMLKMVGGILFSISVAVLAVFVRYYGRRARNSTARVLLQVAPACVFAGMVLSAVYAIADFRGSDLLPIPQMARTHGVLNAVGFCMFGLLGWLVEFDSQPE